MDRLTHHRTDVQYDERIGHIYIPNIRMRRPYSECPYYVRTNRQGFRSDFDYNPENPNNEFRIVFIGDSYTAGDGVSNENRFSDILCQSIGAVSYNFGLSGTGVDQQLLIYKNIAKRFQHNVLVISPHLMDITRNVSKYRLSYDHQTGEKWLVPKPYFEVEKNKLKLYNVPVPKTRKTVRDSETKLFSSSDFGLRKLVSKTRRALSKHTQKRNHVEYENPNSNAWILMECILEEMIDSAGSIPIFLTPLPYADIDLNPRYQERFLALEKKHPNVFFLDHVDSFRSVGDTKPLYFPKDGHYSIQGHEIVAKALRQKLIEKGVIPPSRSEDSQSGFNVVHQDKDKSYILGISAFYHDSAAALIHKGCIVSAAQEERFTRQKNDSRFPYHAINYCLEEAGIHIENLSAIVFYDNPYKTLERIVASNIAGYPSSQSMWNEMMPKWIQTKLCIPDIIQKELQYDGAIHFVDHHFSHAASAFFPSPFQEAAILTVDGVGEWATATISHGQNTSIQMVQEMDFPNSVGLLYSAFTYYTGFKVNEGEYKLMGLAPYGEATYVDIIRDNLLDIHDDGSITLNMEYFGYLDRFCMINESFEKLLGGKPRKPDERINRRICDIAKSIQTVIEEIILKMALHAQKMTNSKYLCMAGGVALNCVTNGKLLKTNLFRDLWIQPASGDSGGSVGAALAYYYAQQNGKSKLRVRGDCVQKGSYLGPEFSRDEVKAYLDSYNFKYTELASSDRNQILCDYLMDGKILGHFSGRMEFGPRSLGARSILGDPRNEKAQSILNMKIKFRESFRPFAPTVLEEDIAAYFDLDRPSPFMLLVASLRKDRQVPMDKTSFKDLIEIVNQKRSDIPAVTHVDYSARIQSINKKDHQVYYELIRNFKKRTGYGMLINTSFNVNREPIICTPKDAVACFISTNMDVLVLENFILVKEEQLLEDIEIFRFKPTPGSTKNDRNEKELSNECSNLYRNYLAKSSVILHEQWGKSLKNESTWIKSRSRININQIGPLDSVTADDVLKYWVVFPAEKKASFRPLIEQLLFLAKTYRVEDLGEGEVNDAIYAMF